LIEIPDGPDDSDEAECEEYEANKFGPIDDWAFLFLIFWGCVHSLKHFSACIFSSVMLVLHSLICLIELNIN
jgi:hypothetical protein